MNEPTPARLTRVADILDEFHADYVAAYEDRQAGRARGPVTGLSDVDEALGGYLAPGLTVLSGNTGVGKTAFSLQIGATCGVPCLYVTAEMSRLELFRRIMARTTNTFLSRIKSVEFEPQVALMLARRAAEAASALAFADATAGRVASPTWIRESAEIVRGDSPHLLIVIDSTHSWAEGTFDGDEYAVLNCGLKELRQIASGLNCSVLMIAEQNRGAMKADKIGKVGDVNAMAGSRKFEYGAEAVLDLHCIGGAQPDAFGEVDVTLSLAKNRNGVSGQKVDLHFNRALQTFR
jgi:replicative DNA helicase